MPVKAQARDPDADFWVLAGLLAPLLYKNGGASRLGFGAANASTAEERRRRARNKRMTLDMTSR